jgi:hypothetical protein
MRGRREKRGRAGQADDTPGQSGRRKSGRLPGPSQSQSRPKGPTAPGARRALTSPNRLPPALPYTSTRRFSTSSTSGVACHSSSSSMAATGTGSGTSKVWAGFGLGWVGLGGAAAGGPGGWGVFSPGGRQAAQ